MRLSRIACASALVLCFGAPEQLRSQGRQPVVLQHGFHSNAGTWDDLAPWLEQHVYVSTSRYTTGWNSPYQVQANRLRDHIQHLPDTTILVGHSNGGVIARRVSHMRRTKGFVTVGTPHTGAPLAAAVMNGDVRTFAGSIERAASEARDYYGRPEFDHFDDTFRQAALWAADVEAVLGAAIGYIATGMSFLDDIGATVLTDMQPGSAFLTGINGVDALHHEAVTAGGPRVAFNSSVDRSWYPEWMIWKGLMPSHSTALSIATDATIFTLLMAYDHYVSYSVPWDFHEYEKQARAVLWLWAAGALNGMDMSWCRLIGAWTGTGCEPADGIVPISRQHHPGPDAVNISLFGPAHLEEINSGTFRDGLREALERRFVVKPPVAK